LCHGGKIVFFGRFVALLRTLAALLAGANRMPWPRFAIMNSLGGLAWATLFAGAAYVLGERIARTEGTIGIGLLAIFLTAAVVGFVLYRRYEKDIEDRAIAALSRSRNIT
jgi:membrane protein DedA with SNARE-associated domain